MRKYVFAENCPADKIREYIEEIISIQKEYINKGKPVPEEYLIPSKIELSPQNMQFLLNSKLVDFIGTNAEGNELYFYWKSTEQLPALEVRTKLQNDGKYYLTYIREEASEKKEAFEWDINSQKGKKGLLTVSKKEDALEDLVDMEEYDKKRR